jgi:DNA-binding MarR family transcriptional regulator
MEIKKTTTYLFSEVTNVYRTGFDKAMSELGLHGGQVFILQLLYIVNGQSQIDLALELNLSPPTIHNMVKSLKKNSFVICNQCQKDARVMRVFLTPKAIELQEQIKEKWLQFEDNFFAALNQTEKLIFFQLLEKLKLDLGKNVSN